MRNIAALLFGAEPGAEPGEPHALRDPREPREECVPGWDDAPAPTGDWCKTPPGRGTLEWLGLTLRSGGRARPLHTVRTRTR
jgi:hypothetical protein